MVGNPLDVIGSGPTVPDTSSFADAYAVLERYGVVGRCACADRRAPARAAWPAQIAETLKPGDPRFEHVQNLIVGSNLQAAEAALAAARAEGFNTLLLTTYLQAEAREAGRVLAAVARELAATGQPLPRPACIVAGGETTVTLRGDGQRRAQPGAGAGSRRRHGRPARHRAGRAGDRRRRRADRRGRRGGDRRDA